jgi:hypothetical protein
MCAFGCLSNAARSIKVIDYFGDEVQKLFFV